MKKRILTIMLAATMLASITPSVTANAESTNAVKDEASAHTTGESTIEYTPEIEGHFDEKYPDPIVVLPTSANYKYYVDPERNIRKANVDGELKLPDESTDTGFYFQSLKNPKEYNNTSDKFTVVNKSAQPIYLDATIFIEKSNILYKQTMYFGYKVGDKEYNSWAVNEEDSSDNQDNNEEEYYADENTAEDDSEDNNDTDDNVLDNDTTEEDNTDAENVASDTGEDDTNTDTDDSEQESYSQTAYISKRLDGNKNNFEIAPLKHNGKTTYTYSLKNKSKMTPWNGMDLSLTGFVNKQKASDEIDVVPDIKITWKYSTKTQYPGQYTTDELTKVKPE